MDQAKFERLYAEHAGALFSFLVYRTGDRAKAEDVVADTFERALQARRRFDPRRGSEKGWLYTIALNRLSDLDRRNAAERRAVEQVGAGGELQGANPLDVIERRTTLGAALDGLSVQEREAVALRFGGDLALKEMAQVTGEAVTTVEGRLYRALRKLRSALE